MRVSIETTEGLERKMTIAVPGEQVDTAVNARLQDAAKNVNLKGFRRGKVPFKVIKGKFGKGVRQEVVGELMSQTYYEAISQESLKPAGQPKIEATNVTEGEDLEFTAIFEVYPEITLPDFSKIEVERLSAEIEEADIDEMILTLRQQRQIWEVVERPAAIEDRVNIDFVGTLGGEEFEGGRGSGTNLVLGSERMIPGFETGIVGNSSGEVFVLTLEFPGEYYNEELAGKPVEFEITLSSVSTQVLPELDEEFFKSFGIDEGGEPAFREEVSNNMQRELKVSSRSKLKNQVMGALIDAVDVSVPATLIAGEIQQLRDQAMQKIGAGKNIDPAMLPDDLFTDQARRRVVLGLILGEVVQQHKITADPVRVREAVEELASTYESPDDVINWYYGDKEQLGTVESTVIEDQVFDHIIDAANVRETRLSYQEVIKPEPSPVAAANTAETEERPGGSDSESPPSLPA
ncbi:MAG: trigger factor [Proteobacteria bacterium]|nr:trigger factor [Pseudomonadota bacterium]